MLDDIGELSCLKEKRKNMQRRTRVQKRHTSLVTETKKQAIKPPTVNLNYV